MRQIAQPPAGRASDGHGQRPHQHAEEGAVAARLHLRLDDHPVAFRGLVGELVQQHRLADAAQSGDDDTAHRPIELRPLQDGGECGQFVVAPDQHGRTQPGTG